MVRSLWQLMAEDPSTLTCDECFALMEYYAELLTEGEVHLSPAVIEHLRGCPNCEVEHREALGRLLARQPETGEKSADTLAEP